MRHRIFSDKISHCIFIFPLHFKRAQLVFAYFNCAGRNFWISSYEKSNNVCIVINYYIIASINGTFLVNGNYVLWPAICRHKNVQRPVAAHLKICFWKSIKIIIKLLMGWKLILSSHSGH